MTWNYRVCKETYDDGVYYTIREAYYNSNNEIRAVTKRGTSPLGESKEELKEDLEKMLISLNKDVVDLDTIVFASE